MVTLLDVLGKMKMFMELHGELTRYGLWLIVQSMKYDFFLCYVDRYGERDVGDRMDRMKLCVEWILDGEDVVTVLEKLDNLEILE